MLRERDSFQFPHAQGPPCRFLWQVTHKSKVLTVQSACRQGEHDGDWPDHWQDLQSERMRSPHHGRARIGDGRHASLADQAGVVPGQGILQQGPRIEVKLMVTFLVQYTRQLAQAQLLEGSRQRVQRANTLEVGARRLGVFTYPVGELRGLAHRALGHHVLQGRLRVAPEIERCRNQEQAPRCCHNSLTPAARSIRLVRINGRPTRADGSSLSIDSSSVIPRPSLLALPAQSYGFSIFR